MNEKLSNSTNRTTVFIPLNIKEQLPDRVNLSGLIRDLLSDYVNHGVGQSGGEWKEGFKELYSFFEAVMKQSKRIIKNEIIWNNLLNQRDIKLIDKLGGELL